MKGRPRWFWFPLYAWASLNALIGLALLPYCRPRDSYILDGVWIINCDRLVGGEWVDGQTWGPIVLIKKGNARQSLLVHEFAHVLHSLILGPLFLIGYGGHYAINRVRGMKHRDAYRGIWSEKLARMVAEEFESGARPNPWGSIESQGRLSETGNTGEIVSKLEGK